MTNNSYQNTFIGGELSPNMYSRLDDGAYKTGAAKIENFLIRPTGLLQKRSGFRFVCELPQGSKCRLIPFRFASNQTLVLIFTNKKLYIATQGQLVLSGDEPYSIETPFADNDLWTLSFSQNADVITFTSLKYPPVELRRYAATDWRFENIILTPVINPPQNLVANATYPKFEPANPNDKDPNEGTYDIITARYVVTAVDNNGIETEASAPCEVKCNYYITGANVELSWAPVANAEYYRVYRYVSGIYSFLGETNVTNLIDEGNVPDSSVTPPRYKNSFLGNDGGGRIIAIEVTDKGSGYIPLPEDGTIEKGDLVLQCVPAYIGGGVRCSGGTPNHQPPNVAPPPDDIYISITIVSKGKTKKLNLHYAKVGVTTGSYSYKVTDSSGQSTVECDTTTNTYLLSREYYVVDKGYKIKIEDFEFDENAIIKFPEDAGSVGMADDWSANDDAYYDINHMNLMTKSKRQITNDDFINGVKLSKVGYSASSVNNTFNLKLKITDKTGKGAVANCLCKDGKIEAANVISQGSGYTDPQITVESLSGSGATFKVKLAENVPPEYPRANTQYDQRRVFAGSIKNPLKVWFTNAGKQSLMSYHLPILADDRIEIVAVTSDADMIKHAVALDSLLLFTGSSELRVYTVNSDSLTPSSVAVRAQSYNGANDTQPIVVSNSVIYISARGGHPRQITYVNNAASYVSDDLGIRCSHLFDGLDIKEIALIKAPFQMLWCLSTNGRLLVCTYIPEQRIVSWCQVVTDGTFESVTSVSEGTEDRIYAVVKRNIGGQIKHFVEEMSILDYANDDDAKILDSFLDATFDSPKSTISGLDHLENANVRVFADGIQQTDKTVHNGSIKLDKAARKVVIGLPVVSTIITLPIELLNETLIQNIRNIGSVSLRISRSGNIKMGAYPQKPNDYLTVCYREGDLYNTQNDDSNVVPLNIPNNWEYQSQIILVSDDCKPLNIYAINYNVQTNMTQKLK